MNNQKDPKNGRKAKKFTIPRAIVLCEKSLGIVAHRGKLSQYTLFPETKNSDFENR